MSLKARAVRRSSIVPVSSGTWFGCIALPKALAASAMRCSGRVSVRATTITSTSTVSSVAPCSNRRSRVSGLALSRK